MRWLKLGAIGAFFTGILSIIQGCDAREGILLAIALFALNFCSGPGELGIPDVDNWPLFMHDTQHTGRSPFVGPNTPQAKWVFDTGNPGYLSNGSISSPVIGRDGTIYLTSSYVGGGAFIAINSDGTPKCSYSGPAVSRSFDGTPAIAPDGTIYVGGNATPDDLLYAFDSSCVVKAGWPIALPNPTNQSPTTPTVGPDGMIYIGLGNAAGSSRFFAVTPAGVINWFYTASGNFESTAAFLANGNVVIASATPRLHILDKTTGTEVCGFPLPSSVVVMSPTIALDGTIYQAYGSASFKAINPNCTEKWTFALPADHITRTVALGSTGVIYAATLDNSNNGRLFAINPNGTEECQVSFGDGAGNQVVDGNGTIYVHVGQPGSGGLTETKLYAINPNCTVKWTITTGGGNLLPAAISADGVIYVSDVVGDLYAVGNP